jgi:hypothetical protein
MGAPAAGPDAYSRLGAGGDSDSLPWVRRVMNTTLSRFQVLVAGVCSLRLALGVARFSYTPLLP